MGNQLVALAPSQILPVEQYINDLHSSYRFKSRLGSTRFMKVAKVENILSRVTAGAVSASRTAGNANASSGYSVVKVFVLHNPAINLRQYVQQLKDHKERLLTVSCHCLPFYAFGEADSFKFAYLVRPFIKSSLYNRMNTRPFWRYDEKLWIAFQLLWALEEAHAVGVFHGDIKTENVMITSWNWLYLTDFAPFKPVLLPEDNPSDFSYYFDTSGRRVCFVAPERFRTAVGRDEQFVCLLPGDEINVDIAVMHDDESGKAVPDRHNHEIGSTGTMLHADNAASSDSGKPKQHQAAELTSKMDIFSAGCLLIELFSDGEAPFDLSTLLQYVHDQYYPKKALERIKNMPLREMLKSMISRNPNDRLEATVYLGRYRGTVFPDYFYTFLKGYMHQFSLLHHLNADQRLVRLSDDLSKCTADPAPASLATAVIADRAVGYDTLSPAMIILLPVLTSCWRQLRKSATREEALFVAEKFARYLPSAIVIDRLLPYILHSVGDKFARIRAQTITVVVNILRHIDDVRPEDAHLHIGYVLPAFAVLAQDQSVHVRITYARSIAELARSGLRFLQQAQLHQAYADSMPSNAEMSSSPSVLPGALLSFQSFTSTTDVAAAVSSAAVVHSRSRINFHAECRALQSAVSEPITSFMLDPNSEVKKALLRSTIVISASAFDGKSSVQQQIGSGLAYLFQFFGIQKSLELLMTHMATFLNEKRDHELRAAFFENVFGIGLALMPNTGVATNEVLVQTPSSTSVGKSTPRPGRHNRTDNSNVTDSGQLLHPLLEQGISDASELVIGTALEACQSLVFAGAMNEVQCFGLVDVAMPLLLHPSPNIRQGVVVLITRTYRRFGFARFLYRVRDRLQFFLTTPVIIVDTNEVLTSALKPPVPSTLLDLLVSNANVASTSHDDEAFDELMQRWSQQVLADIRNNNGSQQTANGGASTAKNFVISDSELEKMKRSTYMLYDKLRARNLLGVRGGALESAVLMYPILSRIRRAKRSSTDALENEVLQGASRRSSSTAILSSLSATDALNNNNNAYFEPELTAKIPRKGNAVVSSSHPPPRFPTNSTVRLPYIPVPHRSVRTFHLEKLKSPKHARLAAVRNTGKLSLLAETESKDTELKRPRSASAAEVSVQRASSRSSGDNNNDAEKRPVRADSENVNMNDEVVDAERRTEELLTPEVDDSVSMMSSTTSSAGTLISTATVTVHNSAEDEDKNSSSAAITASSDSNTSLVKLADKTFEGGGPLFDSALNTTTAAFTSISAGENQPCFSLTSNEHEEAFKYEQGAVYRKLESLVQQQHHRLVASRSSSSHLDFGSAAAAAVAASLNVPSSASEHQFDVSGDAGGAEKNSANTLLPLMSNAFAPGFPLPLPTSHDAVRHHHHQHRYQPSPPPFVRRARHALPKGILVAHMQEHSGSVRRIRVHPVQSHVFATCSKDGSVKVWNVMRIENAPASASNAVTSAATPTTSSTAHKQSSAVVPNKSRQTYWPFAERQRQQQASNETFTADDSAAAPSSISTMHFCQWGTAMVVGAADGRFCVLDVERDTYKLTPQTQSTLGRHTAATAYTPCTSDGLSGIVESLLLDKYTTECTFAVAHVNGTINAYDLRAPSVRPIWNVRHDAALGLIRATCTGAPYQTWFVTGTAEGHLVLWDQRYLVPVKSVCHCAGYAVSALRTHPAGNAFLIAAFCGRNEVIGWKLDTDTPVVKFNSSCDYLIDAEATASAVNTSKKPETSRNAPQPALLDDPLMNHTIRGMEILNVGPLDSDLSLLTAGTDCRIRVWDSVDALEVGKSVAAAADTSGVSTNSKCGIIVPCGGEPAPALLLSAQQRQAGGKHKSAVTTGDRNGSAAAGGYWPSYRAKVSDGILCVQELWSFRVASSSSSGTSASTRSGGLNSPSATQTSPNVGGIIPPSAPSGAAATDSEMFYMRHFYDPWTHPHIDAINDIALINTEHQQFLASASRDGVVKLWK